MTDEGHRPDRQPADPPSSRRGVAGRSTRPRLHLITLVVAALLGGLLVGRFVGQDATSGAAPISTPARPTTSADRIAELEAAVARDPDDPEALHGLALAYLQRASETGDPRFHGLAGDALDRAETLAPDAPQLAIARGALANGLHDFTAARAHALAALDAVPANRDALAVLVDAHVELGEYDLAAARLQELLDRRPSLPALARASYLRQLNGDLPGAILAMQQARVAGSGAPAHVAGVSALLGDLHLLDGDLAAAEAAYRSALDSSPELPPAEVGLARIDAARGDLDAAIDRLEALVDRVPLPAAAILLGDLQAVAGDDAAAAATDELVRAMIALQAESGQAIDLELAVFEADRGEGERAVELARRAYDERATVFTADALAWALHVAGRSDAALPYVEEATRLGTVDLPLRLHAAFVLAATGETEVAAETLREAFTSDPSLAPRLQDDAVALAGELDVGVPARWRSR